MYTPHYTLRLFITVHTTLYTFPHCTVYTLHVTLSPVCTLHCTPPQGERNRICHFQTSTTARKIFVRQNELNALNLLFFLAGFLVYWAVNNTVHWFSLVFWFIELLITLSIGQLKMHDQMVNAEETNSTYYFRCLGWRYQPHTTCDKSHDLQTYWGAQQSLQQKCHRFKFFIDTGQQCFMSLQHS